MNEELLKERKDALHEFIAQKSWGAVQQELKVETEALSLTKEEERLILVIGSQLSDLSSDLRSALIHAPAVDINVLDGSVTPAENKLTKTRLRTLVAVTCRMLAKQMEAQNRVYDDPEFDALAKEFIKAGGEPRYVR